MQAAALLSGILPFGETASLSSEIDEVLKPDIRRSIR